MKLLGLRDSSRRVDGMLIPSYAHLSICDWDTEDHKQDGRLDRAKIHGPLGSSTLKNRERHITFYL